MKDQQEVDTNDGSEVNMTSSMEALWLRFMSLNVVGKRSLKFWICEISYTTMISIVHCLKK